jgi:NAD(P)-dependent dehydrogenase (short-subunit alcohol dehydrogenase family)
MVKRVSPQEAKDLIDGEGYVYVDVRSIPEWDESHPAGSFNVPLMHMGPAGMAPNPDFLAVMEKSFPKDSKLVLGCKGGGLSDGPVYVVTGATGVLGGAVVDALLADGARVGAPHRSTDAPAELRARAGAERLLLAEADASATASMERFLASTADAFGRVDGLAAIAGAYAGAGPFEQSPADEWTQMLDANLQTAYAACRAALPHLLKTGGRIVTIASLTARDGGAGAAAYAVAKSGVMALTRVVALENKDRGVRANCVLPGVIDTPDNRRAMPKADRARWTPPAVLAGLVAFLLSPGSAPLTGALLPADGPLGRA